MDTAQIARDDETLDELEQWLAWFSTQPGADRTPYWLAAFRRLRQTRRAMLGQCAGEQSAAAPSATVFTVDSLS